ncbi:DMT family transporter, partial [bacterium]|nr:DMT family transporter [bacterium]
MNKQRKAYLYGLTAVILWSTVATAFKISLRYLDPIQLLLFSSIASILTLGFVLVFQRKLKEVFSLSKKQYALALGLGLLNPVLYYLILFKAYDLLPAQEAQPINYTWALILSFLSIPLLKQKISKRDIISGVMGYFGVYIISTHGDVFSLRFSDTTGVVLALISTVVWALYWIYNTKSDIDPVIGLLLNFLFGFPFVLLVCYLFSNFNINSIHGVLGAVYVGVFEMGIAFVCWLMALKLSVNTAKVGNLIFISPFLSLVFIHFFVGEKILSSTFVGLIFIMLGLLTQQAN